MPRRIFIEAENLRHYKMASTGGFVIYFFLIIDENNISLSGRTMSLCCFAFKVWSSELFVEQTSDEFSLQFNSVHYSYMQVTFSRRN